MRGRILWAVLITAAVLTACGRKDSLFIEPGKAGPASAQPEKPAPARPAPAKPAQPPPKS
ncbi:MAG TPA: hypothetical protein VHV27_03685 [Phenylobacterium sp.]|nr:hypothetical protein [Phenylobacterium sp.]